MYIPTTIRPGINSGKLVPFRYEPDAIPLAWEELEPFIERSIEESFGMLTTKLIYEMLVRDQATAFATIRDGAIECVLILMMIDYTTYRSARIIALGGKNLKAAYKFVDALEAWAFIQGAVEIEGWCRPSMERLVRRLGWHKRVSIVVRDMRSKMT